MVAVHCRYYKCLNTGLIFDTLLCKL